ncbi:histidine phosphatase family protein [Nocardioides panzhihuensis]|uniref:Putative phosphoglycerate mutase n=1 Tax=Nocardioides panzhihuensis TaxID=860243 RepID=A0A7Z0DPS5_9ACTN|nr:histidine phosphatase family protein [Nocardioides panzhihuensis]NYI79197.1 putative phosphoglycerate mutase [Nocardioides panzhihuensis]
MALFLVRHGTTEWSLNGRHTSHTDLPLLPEGEESALALAPRLKEQTYAAVLTSPRQRALRTAELAGFPDATVTEDLVEWDYGDYEGITTPEIHRTDPGWSLWTSVTPRGEPAASVQERLARVATAARERDGDTLVFSHGHSLCALAAVWLGLPVSEGRLFRLDTATVSMLDTHHDQPVVKHWNT